MADINSYLQQGYVPLGYRKKTIDPVTQQEYVESDSKLGRMARVLGNFLAQERQKQAERVEMFNKQADMYNKLREAGYDPKAAHDAVYKKYTMPSEPGGYTSKETQSVYDIMKTQAETQKNIAQAKKAEYEASGNLNALDQQKLKNEQIKEEKTLLEKQKLEAEIAETEKRNKFASESIVDSAFDTFKTISEVEKGINHFGMYGNLPSIPGSERATWESNVQKILSGRIVDLIAEMKQASKTGATGFGQLSEKEGKILMEAATALKRSLSPKDAQKILTDMKEKLFKVLVGQKVYIRGKQYMITGGDFTDPDLEEV